MIWQPASLNAACAAEPTAPACSGLGFVYLNLLMRLYGGSVDQRKKESCRDDADRMWRDGREYDFIVVGAGAAGCVVANRLTENPKWKVLLLEAGPEEPDITSVPGLLPVAISSNIDWKYSTEPNGKSCLAYPGERSSWPRGKTMGGSTTINAYSYIRGNKVDYDEWARMGNRGWSYDEVLPFFKKSERNLNIDSLDSKYHGVRGEQYVSLFPYIDGPSRMLTKAYGQAGLPILDYNGAEQVGAIQAQTISVEGERASANAAFIRPVRYQRPNLYIETNAEARKILIDENKNAYGIVYIKNNKKYKAYARKEVIICGGAIDSPKLLMLSGIGPQEHLESLNIPVVQDLPVGKNLHDHVTFDGVVIGLSNETATSATQEEILRAVKEHAKMKIKRGPLTSTGPVNSIAFIKTEPDLIAPDIQFAVSPVPNVERYIQDPINSLRASILPIGYYNGLIMRPMNLVPYSRGELLLNCTDLNGPPLIYPNYLDDDRDLIPMLKGVHFALSLQKTEAFQSSGAYFIKDKLPHCKQYEWGTDEYYICLAKAYTSSTYHPGGSCKMGPAWDNTAVLDNELRVYGVTSLRVIDASIMPFVVRGNTNAPSIMIGERGVDFVIKYWRARTRNYC